MSSQTIHERARQMVAQSKTPLSQSEALSRLAKRRKRKPLGVLHPMRADRTAFDNVEQPAKRFWWMEDSQ